MLSQEQKDYIRKHYDPTRYGSIKQIADSLGLNPTTVLYNLRVMGIHRHRNKQPHIPTCNMPEYRRVYYRVYQQALRIIKKGGVLPYSPSQYAIQAVHDYSNGVPIQPIGNPNGLPVQHIDVAENTDSSVNKGMIRPKEKFHVPVVTVRKPKRIDPNRPRQHDKTSRHGILVGDYVPGTRPKGLYQRMLAECFT